MRPPTNARALKRRTGTSHSTPADSRKKMFFRMGNQSVNTSTRFPQPSFACPPPFGPPLRQRSVRSVPRERTRRESGNRRSWNFRRRCRGRRKLAAAFRVSRIASRSRRWVVATRPSFAMPVVITDEPWVPAQEKFESGADFRSFARAKESRKRAREIEANGGVEDDEMVDEHEMHRLRKASRPTYHQVVGKRRGARGRSRRSSARRRS